jgi:hypothetical protein
MGEAVGGVRVTRLVLGFFVAALCGAQSAGAAPLGNPGFEDGVLAPWFQGVGTLDFPHDEFWSVTTSSANSGSWSASNVGNNELRQDFVPTATSAILEISFYLRKEGITGQESAIQLHYLDGSFSQQIVFASEFDVWEKQDATAALTPGKHLTGISVFGVRSDVPTRTYVDDFAMLVPEPQTAVLVAIGLVGLARCRRASCVAHR